MGPIETNCYLVTCLQTAKSLLIDPGDEYEKIEGVLSGRPIEFILNTHGHIDHVKEDEKFGVPVYIHSKDKECLADASKNLSAFVGEPITIDVDAVVLEDGDTVKLGEAVFEVLHTPGHSAGSVSFKAEGILFSGDTLFCGDYGRTDLPGGSEEELFSSVRGKLLSLPGETVVYPGHGPCTSIGEEKKFWDSF